MFVLGGAVLAGLFLAPRPKSPPAPADVPVGVPEGPLKFAVMTWAPAGRASARRHRGRDCRRRSAPDYVILLHVSLEDAAAIAGEFGMQGSYDPRLGQQLRDPEAGSEKVAACILSRHPLYDAEPLTLPPAKEPYGHPGVVGGRRAEVPRRLRLGDAGRGEGFAESWKRSAHRRGRAGSSWARRPNRRLLELTSAGFSQGWGLPTALEQGARQLAAAAHVRGTMAAPPVRAGTRTTRAWGSGSSLGGGAVASSPATMPVPQPSTSRPARL